MCGATSPPPPSASSKRFAATDPSTRTGRRWNSGSGRGFGPAPRWRGWGQGPPPRVSTGSPPPDADRGPEGDGGGAGSVEVEESGHPDPVQGRVAHARPAIDRVAVVATHPLPAEQPGRLEVADDPVAGSLGDADGLGDLTHPHARVACQTDHDLTVTGQQGPAAPLWRWGMRDRAHSAPPPSIADHLSHRAESASRSGA